MNEHEPEASTDPHRTPAEIERHLKLESSFKSGANWFYWIAGFSIINSAVALFNGEWSFIVGLGVTQIADGFAMIGAEESPELRPVLTAVALTVNFIAVTMFAAFGFQANQRKKWAFRVGMTLYGLDGLIFLPFGDFLSFGFHLFALWGIYNGLRALNQMEEQQVPYGALA